MVSHDIKEVAYMADRIVILAANPGCDSHDRRERFAAAAQLSVGANSWRSSINCTTSSPAMNCRTSRCAGAAAACRAWKPLPEASSSEIVGLLEYLDARGGTEELFRIASDTHREFGRIINIVEAAEMLDFVDTPKRMVVLEPWAGNTFKATPRNDKAIWRTNC